MVHSLWFVRCFWWVDHLRAQSFPSHALFVHQRGSLCFKIFLRTCLSEVVLGKHAQSFFLSEDFVVLLPCGPCFSKQQAQAPQKHPDLQLPYSEELIVLVCSCWKSALLPCWWKSSSLVLMWACKARDLNLLSAELGVQKHPLVRPPFLPGKMLFVLSGKTTSGYFRSLGCQGKSAIADSFCYLWVAN